MNVDIYIREKEGTREIRVPWLPDKIDYKSGGTVVASYDIMKKGEVAVPTGSELVTISWKSQFPGANRTDRSMLRGAWQDPSVYHNIIEDWRAKGTILNLMVLGYPINKDVTLDDYSAVAAGGFGDMEYEISFQEYREIIITTSVQESDSSTTEQKRPAAETTSYTIKKGDCMWSIAQRFLGSGAKWPTIYQANKEIIDSTAKKYGHSSSDNGRWIFPGVTIQIPKQ